MKPGRRSLPQRQLRCPIVSIVISEDEVVAQLATLPFATLPPQPEKSVVAIEAPGNGAGNWVGAPSAIRHGDEIFLAYRLRRPIGQGRGYAVEIARSDDGENFTTLQTITKEQMDTESLE